MGRGEEIERDMGEERTEERDRGRRRDEGEVFYICTSPKIVLYDSRQPSKDYFVNADFVLFYEGCYIRSLIFTIQKFLHLNIN